ncbi:MAG TPA: hypothetical protein DD473_27375 [Planctomycetaceae bacterium]|nr:hypothetical protein [Planctomycetaceae bacterium]
MKLAFPPDYEDILLHEVGLSKSFRCEWRGFLETPADEWCMMQVRIHETSAVNCHMYRKSIQFLTSPGRQLSKRKTMLLRLRFPAVECETPRSFQYDLTD